MAGAETVRLVVPASSGGLRLDKFLASSSRVGSRAFAQRLIDRGQVTVDGKPARKSDRVQEGSRVELSIQAEPRGDRQGSEVPYEVAYRDENLVVIDKPAGVVVHPAPSYREGTTLTEALAGGQDGESGFRPALVHRLDRDTSGLLIVAKSRQIQRKLQSMLRRREITREYLALVEGRLDARSGTIDAPLGRDRRKRTVVSIDTSRPRKARTHFVVEEYLSGTTLVRVRLETGRTHQIRAHFASIGHPVAGDPTYGCSGLLKLKRQFLHSTRLGFTHPETGRQVEVESELPADLLEALSLARREV